MHNSKNSHQGSIPLRAIHQNTLNHQHSHNTFKESQKGSHMAPRQSSCGTTENHESDSQQHYLSSDTVVTPYNPVEYPATNNFSSKFKVNPISLWVRPQILDPRIKTVLRIRPFLSHEIPSQQSGSFECFTECTSNVITMPTVKEQKRQAQSTNAANSLGQSTLSLDRSFLNNELSQHYQFTSIVPPWLHAQDTFTPIVKPYCDVFLHHYNATLIAYGQTGSGKTYTMAGSLPDRLAQQTMASGQALPADQIDIKSGGIMMASIDYIYKYLSTYKHQALPDISEPGTQANGSPSDGRKILQDYTLECSFVEVYNDKITDLLHFYQQIAPQMLSLNRSNPNLSTTSQSSSSLPCSLTPSTLSSLIQTSVDSVELYETSAGQFVPKGLEKIPVTDSIHDCIRIIEYALARRQTTATLMNRQSSRSHLVFTLYLTSTLSNGQEGPHHQLSTHTSKLCLVDLAGSERIKQSGVTGHALKEATMINKSLSCLTKVIKTINQVSNTKLSMDSSLMNPEHGSVLESSQQQQQQQQPRVPYRDNVLTKLLKDSLGGNSATCLIACISPAQQYTAETIRTLRFAQNAGKICNTITMNQNEDPSNSKRKLSKTKTDTKTKALSAQIHLLITELKQSQQHTHQLQEELAWYKQLHASSSHSHLSFSIESGSSPDSALSPSGAHQMESSNMPIINTSIDHNKPTPPENQLVSDHTADTASGSSTAIIDEDKHNELISLRSAIPMLQEHLQHYKTELQVSQSDLKMAVRTLHRETNKVAQLKADLIKCQEERDQHQCELDTLQKDYSELQNTSQQTIHDLMHEKQQLDDTVHKLNAQHTELLTQHACLNNTHTILLADFDTLQQENDTLKATQQQLKEELKLQNLSILSLQGELQINTKTMSSQQKIIRQLECENADLATKTNQITLQYEQATQQIQLLSQEQKNAESELLSSTQKQFALDASLIEANHRIHENEQRIQLLLEQLEESKELLTHADSTHKETLNTREEMHRQELMTIQTSLTESREEYENLTKEHASLTEAHHTLSEKYEEMIRINKTLYISTSQSHISTQGKRSTASTTSSSVPIVQQPSRRGDRFDLSLSAPLPLPGSNASQNVKENTSHLHSSSSQNTPSGGPAASLGVVGPATAGSASSQQYDSLHARTTYLETINEERKYYRDRCKRLEDELDALKLREALGNRKKIVNNV